MPKRKSRTRKVVYKIHAAIQNTNTDVVLYTATENCTVLRQIIDVWFTWMHDAANRTQAEIMLHKKPRGQLVAAGVTAASAGVEENECEIIRQMVTVQATAQYDSSGDKKYFKDLRGNRELQEGDEINLSHIAGSSDFIRITGTIVLIVLEQ